MKYANFVCDSRSQEDNLFSSFELTVFLINKGVACYTDFKILYLLYFNDGLGFLFLQLLLGKLDFINSLLKSIVSDLTACS